MIALITALYGMLHGLFNGAALAAAGAGVTSLLGTAATVLLLALIISATVVPLQSFAARLAVRVAGSWVVALGILMLGWLVQKH